MFKEADFTLCQASFQAVFPAEEDVSTVNNKNKLRGLSPRANYTDRAAAAGRRS